MSMIINPYRFSQGSGTDIPSANAAALLHMDGADGSTTFTDATGRTWATLGAAQIDTAQFVFGGASGLFDGTAATGIQSASDAAIRLGAGDFTIAWRERNIADNQFRTVYDHGYTSGDGILIQSLTDTGSNQLRHVVYMGGTATVTETSDPSLNTWYHYELVRASGMLTLRRNGVSVGSGTSSTNVSSTAAVAIGRRGAVDQHRFAGWLDEFLVVKGIALHTSDFTPPNGPYVLV